MHVLLTGAGFTKNWDGRLAREFQQDLVSDFRVRARPRLLQLLANQRLFEVAYGLVQASPYEDADRAALNAAIHDVFSRMDSDHANIDRLNRMFNGGVCQFISRFCPRIGQTGYFFTVNQDQLVERIFSPPVTAPNLFIPGVAIPPGEKAFGTWNWPMAARIIRFDQGALPVVDGQFNYVKLHGSYNWQTPGGPTPMVIGTGKERHISGNALLSWYFEIFERVLNAGGTHLMTIGYGFADEHINRLISQACRSSGLNLFVWNAYSNPLDTVRKALGNDITPSISEVPLRDLFPSDQSRPAELSRIVGSFFGT
jgi:hypothetical protein